MIMQSEEEAMEQLLETAIREDMGSGDITTEACLSRSIITSGKLILKQRGVIAGFPLLRALFEKIDPEIQFTPLVDEGLFLKAGTFIAKIAGPAQSIIMSERIALNLLTHLSGIATLTAEYVKKVRGLPCAILDTRKTLPGLRTAERYAVRVGGGINHRQGLSDLYIIKSNHLAFLGAQTSQPILKAVELIRKKNNNIPIEIEIENFNQLEEALSTNCQTILLDNMLPEEITRCTKRIRKTDKKVYIESSGAITLDTIRLYAETGVDGIVVGALTNVQSLEIGIRLLI